MSILFIYPGNEELGTNLLNTERFSAGRMDVHHFPDGESLIRLDSVVTDQDVTLLCTLDHPDDKATSLMFFAQTAKEMGARKVTLITPYLGYMRQDVRFHPGEALTSAIFAKFLSAQFDELITIDPHLHRHKSMDEIYTIPTTVLHAADIIAHWIKDNVAQPVLIGPDGESDQWVSDVAGRTGIPYTVLTKTRRGDTDVEVSVPHIEQYRDHTPVLVDDIISTARTMIAAATHLLHAGMKPPVCIGVHAVFAGTAYDDLHRAGVGRIVTCNTIAHRSNAIDVTPLLLPALS